MMRIVPRRSGGDGFQRTLEAIMPALFNAAAPICFRSDQDRCELEWASFAGRLERVGITSAIREDRQNSN